jgi:hypothetical protein
MMTDDQVDGKTIFSIDQPWIISKIKGKYNVNRDQPLSFQTLPEFREEFHKYRFICSLPILHYR